MSEPRIYTPAECGQTGAQAPTLRHAACVRCGGYLQGSREFVGVCLNCEEGRGWAVQAVAGRP
jgi:hypothetical protein